MLDLFSLMNLVYVGTVALADINLYTIDSVKIPPLHGVVAVEFETATGWLADKSKVCNYSSLMVPYERDWEEEVGSYDSKTIRAAEPGKIAGYAFVINKAKCPGKEVENIFSTIEWHTVLRPGHPLGRQQYFQAQALRPNPDSQPKWLPQVVRVIEAAADTNPAAKAFVEFSRATAAAKGSQEMKNAEAQ
jgi:hypothetical protein